MFAKIPFSVGIRLIVFLLVYGGLSLSSSPRGTGGLMH